MNLTTRQKNIVNPYAESYNSSERRGVGYDYESESNRFVLDVIHESFIYFYEFPQIGTVVNGLQREDNSITLNDMLAYFALYPQNGKVSNGQPQTITDAEAQEQLQIVVEQLARNQALKKYTSNTSELTYQREYRDDNTRPELTQ